MLCWLPCVLLLIVLGTGVWVGPPKADYPSASKNWASEEERRAALVAYQRHQAFEGIWNSTFYAAISGPLALGLGLYVVLTEKKSRDYNHTSAKIKLGYGLLALAGAIMIVGAPVFVGYSIWRYVTV